MRDEAAVNWYEEGGIYGPDYLAIVADEAGRGAGEADRAYRLLGLMGGERVLDVACGYGRHATSLAARGVHVVGLDLNAYFLGLAVQRAADTGASAAFVRADMRLLPFAQAFDAAVCLGGSFGQFATEDEDLALLRETAGALKPGGKFLLDVANRDGILSRFVGKDWDRQEDGTVVLHERRWDALSGRLQGRDIVVGPDGRSREYQHSMRLYGAPEIQSLLARAGFEVLALYGSLAGTAVGWDSPRVNVVARRPR
ncbi:MAG TPA: class I SAM-dependent methyltransferase [Chloroflexota bacterium]|nr:class I SAM-dependent methyltransferase [Chloroflexota bacterium]